MSEPPDGDVPPPPPAAAPPPKGIWRRRRRFILSAIGAGVLLLVGTFEAGIRLVPPDTVQVTEHAWAMYSIYEWAPPEGPCPRCLRATDWVTLPIQGRAGVSVADLVARVNDLPTQPWPPARSCIASPERGTYTITFTRWGLPVETATTYAQDSCSRWWLSRGGIPEGSPRVPFPSCRDYAVLLWDLNVCGLWCIPMPPC